jgi:hypothetical protein
VHGAEPGWSVAIEFTADLYRQTCSRHETFKRREGELAAPAARLRSR